MARQIPGYEQAAGTTRTLDVAVKRTVLPGGLRVISEHVPGVRSATVGLWVGIGSRDEPPAVAGAAHYLEHLLFKGTRNRGATEIAEEIDAVGGEFNAFTAKEHTCYYAQVLDEDLPLAMDLVTDVVFEALCTDADVDTERSVVLEEIAMRDDDPEDLLHETFVSSVLAGHPLAKPVLGSEESIRGMSAKALRGFYRRRYTLPRMVLAVAGNVEHRQVLRLARKALRDRLSGSDTPVPPRRGKARITAGPQLALHTDDTEQAHVMLGMRAPSRHDERRYTLNVLNAALGGGMSSRLFQEIREQRGLAYQVYSSVAGYADTGHLSVYAGCQPERLGEVANVLRDVLGQVGKDGFTDAEVARAKGQLRGGLVLGLEDTASRMSRIGKQELNFGLYQSVDDTVARIDAVSTDEVYELARTLFGAPGGVSVAAVVGPYAQSEDLPDDLHEVIAR
ncbi:insulinase family protein [Amycolatopsis acidiphila]|uniref:Insulinase family protein n=1 Tax=Amycolatopsis acidiphila TaxID=715473 RepID=A0A557ZY47_9PSEU|nr:pitrilysin family protein [Amycolatopsis acidiphila]TVT16933.1 insulinase family protein [Amycolatopsis acidiphila]UIJ62102.1 insulinase family protein [Amycolatopsis acidiphila]GHG91889.1 peptidase M16 [Amycolatopsis acidiphila]